MLENLNKQQIEAVLTRGQHVRIIAGAGSGKTRVLTTRIIHLIEEEHIAPWRICAITFTNKAAKEMQERMVKMHPDANRVMTSTIHSLCVRMIREDYEALDLVRNFTILDSSDQQAVLKEIYKLMDITRKELSYRDALSYISGNKMAKVGVEAARKLASNHPIETMKVKVYQRYVARLNNLNALDFDDLLLVVEKLLMSNETALAKWQNRYQVILVDEFQDVDAVQYNIVTLLAGDKNQLYVVGDPDQTIYSWRGANVNFILDFTKRYKDAITITLNQNYRSTQTILDAANGLIANNKNRPPKELFANKQEDYPIVIQGLEDQETESYFVMRQILELKEKGASYLDIAVLYRSNYLSRSLEKMLMSRQIPYVIYGGLRFYDHAEVKDLLSFVRMITHADDLALRRSVSMPRRGIGEVSLERLFVASSEQGFTMYEWMKIQYDQKTLSQKMSVYVELIESMKTYAETHSIAETMQFVYMKSGLKAHYEDLDELSRVENLKELVEDASVFEMSSDDATLVDYIQMISLFSDRNEVVEGEYVRLMTIHASKGLEFENVILLGLNEQVFPNRTAVMEGPSGLEEERRLMYVAMTRAKEKLIVTYHQGHSFVTQTYGRASRFIAEMNVESLKEQAKQQELYDHMKRSTQYRKGDMVIHDQFGEGIVIKVEDNIMRVAFNYPFNTKQIATSFNGIRLKEDLS